MMGSTDFKAVLVIGYGKVAGDVLEYVWENERAYGYKICYIEHEIYPFNRAMKFSQEKGIENQTITDKQELVNLFQQVSERTLIISASNNFLFPSSLLDKENITVINFHNALLPKFPGRNAPSWAIYENEKITGITWHYVTESVDAGDIILQKCCNIDPDIKAYELARDLQGLAFEGFQECFFSVLEERVNAKKQDLSQRGRVYKSTDAPANAHFTDKDLPADIYRLLRAVDYGKNRIFPIVTGEWENIEIQIEGYKKIAKNKAEEKSNRLYLPLGEDLLELKYTNKI